MVNVFMTTEPSKLTDRQQTVLDGRTEPVKLTQQQTGDIQRERVRQTSQRLTQQYDQLSTDFRTYEEKLLGRDKEFSVDANVEIDVRDYEEMEQEFAQSLEPQRQRIMSQKQQVARESQRLQRLGVGIDIEPVRQAVSALDQYQIEAQRERLKFVTDISMEQQADLRQYREKLAQVDLSPQLIQRQEQLLAVAQTNPDLFSKPYIYDKWIQEKQLKEGMTALGYSITDLKQTEGARIEYFDSGAVRSITSPTQQFTVSQDRSRTFKQDYNPYVVEFDESGQIVKEQLFAPQTQWFSQWNQGRSHGFNVSARVQVQKEVLFDGGQVSQVTGFGNLRYDLKARGSSFGSTTTVSYKPFVQKKAIFEGGIVAQVDTFGTYDRIVQQSRGESWSVYRTGGTYHQDTRDYKGGMITSRPTPPTLRQYSSYSIPQTKQVLWQNPLTGKGNI